MYVRQYLLAFSNDEARPSLRVAGWTSCGRFRFCQSMYHVLSFSPLFSCGRGLATCGECPAVAAGAVTVRVHMGRLEEGKRIETRWEVFDMGRGS